MEDNDKYNQNKYARRKNIYHWGLACQQIRRYPIVLVLFIPIFVLTTMIWVKMDYFLSMHNLPKIIFPLYEIAIKTFGVILPIIVTWSVIDAIGSITSRKDEASIQMAFDEKELRNGNPILLCKRKDKNARIIIRKWYSPIPLKMLIEHQEIIEHQMNEFIKKLEYDDKVGDNRILMVSTKGRKSIGKDILFYDNELERDLEKYVK